MEFEGISVQFVEHGILVKTLTGEEFIFTPTEIKFLYKVTNKQFYTKTKLTNKKS